MENINFDDIIKLIKNSLDNGFDKLIIGVLVFTSMLAVINLVLKLITWNGNKNLDSFFKFVFQKLYRT